MMYWIKYGYYLNKCGAESNLLDELVYKKNEIQIIDKNVLQMVYYLNYNLCSYIWKYRSI